MEFFLLHNGSSFNGFGEFCVMIKIVKGICLVRWLLFDHRVVCLTNCSVYLYAIMRNEHHGPTCTRIPYSSAVVLCCVYLTFCIAPSSWTSNFSLNPCFELQKLEVFCAIVSSLFRPCDGQLSESKCNIDVILKCTPFRWSLSCHFLYHQLECECDSWLYGNHNVQFEWFLTGGNTERYW